MKANTETISLVRSAGEHAFSILIPTWNNLSYLKLCIESIRKNSVLKHQVIVHVNEGSDGTKEWVEAQPDLDYSYSPENIGVCYALNSCRPIVSSDYIVYVNDDMYLCPNWDIELMKEVKSIGHNYFFLSSTAIEPIASSNCVIEKDYGKSTADFNEDLLLKEYSLLPKQDWNGSTWPPNLVHRDLWDKVGGYSVEFSPGMYSDPDFSMKLWISGVRLYKGVSASRVYHFGSKSVGRVIRNEGYYTFISKWGITSSTLTNFYLKRGEVFSGPLRDPYISPLLNFKNFFKRAKTFLRKQPHA